MTGEELEACGDNHVVHEKKAKRSPSFTDGQLHCLNERAAGLRQTDNKKFPWNTSAGSASVQHDNKHIHRCQVSLGVLLVMAGLVLTMFMLPYIVLVGMAMVCTGLFILIHAFCVVIKSSEVSVPGHFLLHPRTGTCYTHHQAIAVQRRLDRMRRATEENHNVVQLPPSSVTDQISLAETPPPWQMEPPPSYETVMKNTTTINQL